MRYFVPAVPSAIGRSNSRPRGTDMLPAESRATASVRVVRLPEWIIFAFLLYAPALAFFLPTPEGLTTQLASLNAAVILLYASLVWLDSAKPRLILDVIRDWLPLG
jgi:hypothetical protein